MSLFPLSEAPALVTLLFLPPRVIKLLGLCNRLYAFLMPG